ncbi:MAG TPA: GNAT family N-acetyltransferase [Rectinemataceae bacterium]|nr:GNAT family N-acetyltransferase [Rectinemataceae bacterium]
MIIKAMRRESASDWFEFFDNRAFADHEDWKGCYCTGFFMPRLEAYPGRAIKRKDYAAWLIEHELMKGYLGYENGRVVAWCNVNRKSAFPKLKEINEGGEEVLSIACFLVEKPYRRRGIAQKLLSRIIKDAKQEGIAIIEAYPRPRAQTEYGKYRGPFSMYEKNGFKVERVMGMDVMRRHLAAGRG